MSFPIHLPRPTIDEMLNDAFRPIIREGGKEVEVSLRTTATLAALHKGLPIARPQLEALAARHARRVVDIMEDPNDVAAFERVYRLTWPTAS